MRCGKKEEEEEERKENPVYHLKIFFFFFSYRSGIGNPNFTTQDGGWNEIREERREENGSTVYNCLGLDTFS